jgi:hypothetical protein
MEEKKFPWRGKKSTPKMKLVYFGYNKNKESIACKKKKKQSENFQISLEWKNTEILPCNVR